MKNDWYNQTMDKTHLDTVSTTKGWFDCWLRAFGTDKDGIWTQPNMGGDLAIPYVYSHFSLGPFRIPVAMGATNEHTPRYDILGQLRRPSETLQAMMRDCGVSILSFSYLSRSSRLLQAIEKNDTGLFYHIDFCEDSPTVDCTTEWEEYWHSRGKTKSTWRRRERGLLEKHNAEFECISSWERAKLTLPEVFEVEASGWKGRQGSAIQQNDDTLAFYSSIAEQWAKDGALRLFTLSIDGKIIAFQLNALYAGVLYHVKVGFHDDYSSLSPGQALQLQILRWAFADKDVRVFDFLGGGGRAAANKRKWSTSMEALYTLYVFRKNPVGLAAWSRLVAAPAAKRLLFDAKKKSNSD